MAEDPFPDIPGTASSSQGVLEKVQANDGYKVAGERDAACHRCHTGMSFCPEAGELSRSADSQDGQGNATGVSKTFPKSCSDMFQVVSLQIHILSNTSRRFTYSQAVPDMFTLVPGHFHLVEPVLKYFK